MTENLNVQYVHVYTSTDRAALRRAWRAGKRSSLSNVDADEAAARWAGRNCTHDVRLMCDLEHAWYDGFEHDCRTLPWFMRPATRRP